MTRKPVTVQGGEPTAAATITGATNNISGGANTVGGANSVAGSVSGGAENNDQQNTPPTNAVNETPADQITVKVTGELTRNVIGRKGETLAQILKRAGVENPGNYNFRSGSQQVAATRALQDNMELTSVAKAAHG